MKNWNSKIIEVIAHVFVFRLRVSIEWVIYGCFAVDIDDDEDGDDDDDDNN